MLKRFLFPMVILIAISCERKDAVDSQLVEQTIQKFNKAFEEADVEQLELMISENYSHTNGSWKAFGKEKWLEYMQKRRDRIKTGALKIDSYEMHDLNIQVFHQSAVVTGKIVFDGIENGEPFKKEVRVSNFWVIEDGQWKRAGFHDTRIED